MDKYQPGIGIAAGSWMLKWDLLNRHLGLHPIKIRKDDNVNVFINFECVLRNLSMYKNLSNLVAFHKQDVSIELESAILNLVANYKAYFKKEKCNVKIYLYYTNLKNDEPQEMTVYNKYYREYYKNRYMKNPQFCRMGDLIVNTIIPDIQLILSYIEDCYFIKSNSFDGSIIPMIISMFQEDWKNVVISGGIFDTLYMFNPNFMNVYIKRRYQYFSVCTDIESTVQSIVKNQSPFDLSIFNSEMYYKLLLSIKGSKIRNIRSAKGFGYSKFMKLLKDGINKGIILQSFSSIDSIIGLFPDKFHDDIKTAFQCTSLENQYALINQADIDYIKNQIIDRVDISSVEALNQQRFSEYPINLPSLLN